MRELSDDQLRACGLSGGKVRSIRDLTNKVLAKELRIDRLAKMDDETISQSLREVHGIGPWSVDMFLIFCLGRPDVLPVGDLGFRAGVRDLYALSDIPDVPAMQDMAEPWRPYRSIATWYIWRARDTAPKPTK
jgi:DNA-3-methyladenine glycosylase II